MILGLSRRKLTMLRTSADTPTTVAIRAVTSVIPIAALMIPNASTTMSPTATAARYSNPCMAVIQCALSSLVLCSATTKQKSQSGGDHGRGGTAQLIVKCEIDGCDNACHENYCLHPHPEAPGTVLEFDILSL